MYPWQCRYGNSGEPAQAPTATVNFPPRGTQKRAILMKDSAFFKMLEDFN
jgi:hypothetical protein